MARLANMQQGRIAMPKLDLAPKLGDLKTFRSRQNERKRVAAAVLYQLLIAEGEAGAERGAHAVQDRHDRGVKRRARRGPEIDAVHPPSEAIAPFTDRVTWRGHLGRLRRPSAHCNPGG